MFSRRLYPPFFVFAFAVLLSGCMGSTRRDDAAAKARLQMIGMSKEDVLACMGPAKKKASEGATEVWSYLSTDGHSTWDKGSYSTGFRTKTGPYTSLSDSLGIVSGSSEKRFCTVNIVMKNGVVTAVNYLGPMATSFYNDNDQCGYAVAACAR